MQRNKVLTTALLAICLCLGKTGFCGVSLTGTALGPEGAPMANARILLRDAKGAFLKQTGRTAPDGTFSVQAAQTLGALVFADDNAGVAAQVMGPWDAPAALSVRFNAGDFFALAGQIKDPGQTLMAAHMDEGATWSGEFDHIAQRMITINAYAAGTRVIAVHPDGKGAYKLRSNFRLDTLLLYSGGGGVSLQLDGPWKSAATVDFVLTQEEKAAQGAFTLSGRVHDAQGKPMAYERIDAFDASGTKVNDTFVRPTGEYIMTCNQPVHTLRVHMDGQTIERTGPWTASARVDIMPQANNRVQGKVTDETGQPIKSVRIMSYDSEGKNLKTVASKVDGCYEIVTEKPIHSLWAYRDETHQNEKKSGPWPPGQEVNFIFSNKGVFTLSGIVTDAAGAPVRATVHAVDAKGAILKSPRSGKDGKYSMVLNQEVSEIQVFYNEHVFSRKGPWTSEAAVDFALDK